MTQGEAPVEHVVNRIFTTLTSLDQPTAQDIACALMRLPPRPEALQLLVARATDARWPGLPVLLAAIEHLARLATAQPGRAGDAFDAPQLLSLLAHPHAGVVV